MNNLLSICIPTYNRASILSDGLNQLIPLASRWDIPIIIADNASTDGTEDVIARSKARYPYVFLHRNAQNIGMDGNFEVALRLANTEYAWLLGDDDRIQNEALEKVLMRLNSEPCDFLLLNGGSPDPNRGRVIGRRAQLYNDPKMFLHDLGWHATWISGLVISTHLIASLDFKKYQGSYFSHFGSLFEALSKQPVVKIQWYDGSCYYPSSSAKFTWTQRVLEIFADKWTKVVLSLPEVYPLDTKRECMLAHSRHTGLFSVTGLLNLRAQGAITSANIKQYRNSLALATDIDPRLALLIASLPVQLLKFLRCSYIRLRALKQSTTKAGTTFSSSTDYRR